MTPTVAVLGATGFVGRHVVAALEERGAEVRALRGPRVQTSWTSEQRRAYLSRLTDELAGCFTVVNAAGVAQAGGAADALTEANHLMPALVADATSAASVRLVHISSAAVQGRKNVLDSAPEYMPFSPYSVSKAEGEQSLLDKGGDICIYRPPGVHGSDRSVSRALVRLAGSPLAAVAGPGTSNTPQALVQNVADAAAFLATTENAPPRIVHHPSEGMTTATLMTALGGRPPRLVPGPMARAIVHALNFSARVRPGLEGQARRIEVLWFGQEQAPSWLDEVGWHPPAPRQCWDELGNTIRAAVRSARLNENGSN